MNRELEEDRELGGQSLRGIRRISGPGYEPTGFLTEGDLIGAMDCWVQTGMPAKGCARIWILTLRG